jgi:hypothetical protein
VRGAYAHALTRWRGGHDGSVVDCTTMGNIIGGLRSIMNQGLVVEVAHECGEVAR